MRRLMMLVTVGLLMMAMLVASAAPAMAGKVRFWTSEEGTPLPTVVCDVTADASPLVGWSNETCWVFHPGL